MWQRCRVFLRRVQRVLSRLVSILLHTIGQLFQVLWGLLILFACVLLVGPCLALLLLWECLSPFLFQEEEEHEPVSLSPTLEPEVMPDRVPAEKPTFLAYHQDWTVFCREGLATTEPSYAATRKIYRALYAGSQDRVEEETVS